MNEIVITDIEARIVITLHKQTEAMPVAVMYFPLQESSYYTRAYTNLLTVERCYSGNWVSLLYCFNVCVVTASYYNCSFPMQLLYELQ
jgi:hypothetical protein